MCDADDLWNGTHVGQSTTWSAFQFKKHIFGWPLDVSAARHTSVEPAERTPTNLVFYDRLRYQQISTSSAGRACNEAALPIGAMRSFGAEACFLELFLL
jgi:hypothetical protein